MARTGYGKREAPDQLPCGEADFAHLPEREAYLAGFIDRLPEGAAIDYKTLANEQPRYGQQAVRSALNALAEAGHLRRIRETVGEGRTQRVTRTYFSRTARDDAWWARFLAGDAMGAGGTGERQPDERPAARPVGPPRRRSQAYEALASLGTADPRMALSAAECEALEPLAAEWLARGVTAPQLVRALTSGLPSDVHSPGAFARRRLNDKMPPEPAPATTQTPTPRRVMECVQCGRPGSPAALPGGLCRLCRDEQAPAAPPRTDVRAHVARLRATVRTAPRSGLTCWWTDPSRSATPAGPPGQG
jgi:hypothetical protein